MIFFVTGRNYCCFSSLSKDSVGNYIYLSDRILERKNHIKNLLGEFIEHKNFQTIDQFRKEIKRLYQQFIGLNVTDRVLYLNEDNKSVIQKHIHMQGMINIRNSIGQKSYHIVDINGENHSLWFVCKQSKYPQNYYGEGNGNTLSTPKGWSDKELLWENGTKTEILKKLSEKFKRKVIVFRCNKKRFR